MKLWTIHSIEWYKKLLEQGIIYGEKSYIQECWSFGLYGYYWLMKKMNAQIGKPPFADCFPIWAWYQYTDEVKTKPDLRQSGFLPRGQRGVCIEINKKNEEVLLSDFALWHIPFSYHIFIGNNEEECLLFDKMLEMRGLDKKSFWKLPKDVKKTIIKSWDRVLDMDFSDSYFTSPKEEKSIQATFWSLSVDEIIKVEEFIAR